MRRLAWFGIAGGAGFVVDGGMLVLLLSWTPLGPFGSRAVAILVAMAVTWLLNRQFTFGPSGRSLAGEGARYGSIGLASAALNYVLYSGLLVAIPALPPLLALALASALAMLFSWFGYSRLVFRTSQH